MLQAFHAVSEEVQQALQALGVEQLPLTFGSQSWPLSGD